MGLRPTRNTRLLSEKYFQVRRMVFQGTKIRRARLTRHSWCVRRTLKGNYLFERRLISDCRRRDFGGRNRVPGTFTSPLPLYILSLNL